jgi:N-acetylated-alpha-linked acidic dipeptidase
MANIDVLPYDYEEYGKEISAYISAARKRADAKFSSRVPDFSGAAEAAKRLQEAGAKILVRQKNPPSGDLERLNHVLRDTESALLIPEGLPNRPWYRHVIYAPGQYTGYAAVVIPGVNEAIDAGDVERVREQIAVLTGALQRAVKLLDSYR